jgi:hypothetical protein
MYETWKQKSLTTAVSVTVGGGDTMPKQYLAELTC